MTDMLRPFRVSDQYSDGNATEIRRIVHGTVNFDPPSIAAFGVATATAAFAGLTTDMKVLVGAVASAATAAYAPIAARSPSANILEVTFANPHSATDDPSSMDVNVFAYR